MDARELLRLRITQQARIRAAVLEDFEVDPTWTKGAVRHMVVVRDAAKRLGVREVGWPFMRLVYAACCSLGARRVKPRNKALWRGLRRRGE